MQLYLKAPVTDAGDDTLVLRCLGVSQSRPDRPPDRTILHLELISAAELTNNTKNICNQLTVLICWSNYSKENMHDSGLSFTRSPPVV